jgi:hypothetical protein
VIALASPGGRKVAGPAPRPSTAPPTATTNAAGEATVAVLNGTTVTGLARAAADDLEAYGFREGVVTNDATNQQRDRTEIYYEPGFREQAQTAAGCLDVGLNRIHPMTENARVLGDRADIVVFIGVDKAR